MDEIPEGLEDLLNSIRGEGKPQQSSALAVIPKDAKQETDLVNDEIDERILALLGLENVTDIDYATYKTLLGEKMMEGRMVNNTMSTEEVELLTNEFKRVKSATGRFNIKRKKINVGSFFETAQEKAKTTTVEVEPVGALVRDPMRDLQGPEIVEDLEKQQEEDDKSDQFIRNVIAPSLNKIEDNLQKILETVTKQFKFNKKQSEKAEDAAQNVRKKEREEKREAKTKSGIKDVASNVVKPVKGLFDMIIDFFKNILLGGALLRLVKFLQNPAKAIQPIIDVLDNIIKFVNSVIKTVFDFVFAPINAAISAIWDGLGALEDTLNNLLSMIPRFFGQEPFEPIDNINEENKPKFEAPQFRTDAEGNYIPLPNPFGDTEAEAIQTQTPASQQSASPETQIPAPQQPASSETQSPAPQQSSSETQTPVQGQAEGGVVLNVGNVSYPANQLTTQQMTEGGQVTNLNVRKVGGFKSGGKVKPTHQFLSPIVNLGYSGGGSVTNNTNVTNTKNLQQGGGVQQPQRQKKDQGMFGPAIMPWNWGKFVDQHRNANPEDYKMQQGNPLRGFAARRQQMEAIRGKSQGLQQGGTVINNSSNLLGGGSVTSNTSTSSKNISTHNAENISYAEGGPIKPNSGVNITGMGRDTQLIAAEPGEIMMSRRAVQMFGANNLLSMNAAAGSTNKPKMGTPKFAGGMPPIVATFNQGGMVFNPSDPLGSLTRINQQLKTSLPGVQSPLMFSKASPLLQSPSTEMFQPTTPMVPSAPKATINQVSGADFDVILPLDHTKKPGTIPDTPGGNTFKNSNATGADGREREHQDKAATIIGQKLTAMGLRVKIMTPEEYPSYQDYDQALIKFASKGIKIVPLHFDAKGSVGFMTRTREGDAGDARLASPIQQALVNFQRANPDLGSIGSDTEGNATINRAAVTDAALVELGVMVDWEKKYGKDFTSTSKFDELATSISTAIFEGGGFGIPPISGRVTTTPLQTPQESTTTQQSSPSSMTLTSLQPPAMRMPRSSQQMIPPGPPVPGKTSIIMTPGIGGPQPSNSGQTSAAMASQKKLPFIPPIDSGNNEFIVIKSIYNIIG